MGNVVLSDASSPASEHVRDRRDREGRMRSMLDAAIALMADEGPAVSTRRIAERANCSENLIFRYYGGKRGLLHAIGREFVQLVDADRRPEPAVDATVDGFIEQYLVSVGKRLRLHSGHVMVITTALIGDRELQADVHAFHDGQVRYISNALREFQQRGQISTSLDVAAIATAIAQIGFGGGLLTPLVSELPERSVRAMAKALASTLARGLSDDCT